MKYPYIRAKYASLAVAVAERDKYNERRRNEDLEAFIQKGKDAWLVVVKVKGGSEEGAKDYNTHRIKHLESEIQRTCVAWFRLLHPCIANLLFAVPNGGKRSKVEASIMKAEGTTAGVADLLLLVPNQQHHALCIEMKTENGRQSSNQKMWQKAVTEQGYQYSVCHSFEEFQETVNGYLSNR